MGIFETFYNLFGLILLGLLLSLCFFQNSINKKYKKLFILTIIINMTLLIFSSIDYFLAETHDTKYTILRSFTSFVGYALTPLIPCLLVFIRTEKIKWYNFILIIINFVFCFISLFYPLIYKIENNSFITGPLLYFPTISGCIYLLSLIIIVIIKPSVDKLTKTLLLIMCLTIILASIIEAFIDVKFLCWNLTAIGLMLYYNIMVIEHYRLDSITKVYTRRFFDDEISKLSKRNCTIVMSDIDNFKSINDNYGHIYGDQILRLLGSYLIKDLAKYANIYRYGGDEFILISNLDKNELKKLLEKSFNSRFAPCKLSYGITEYQPGEDFSKAISIADRDLYENKQKR